MRGIVREEAEASGLGSVVESLVCGFLRQMLPSLARLIPVSPNVVACDSRDRVDYSILGSWAWTGGEAVAWLERNGRASSPGACWVVWVRRNQRQELQDWVEKTPGWRLVSTRSILLWPFHAGAFSRWINRWWGPLVPGLCRVSVVVVRRARESRNYSLSVVVPMRNEAGNVRELLDRIPTVTGNQELLVVEGGSEDRTWAVLKQETQRPSRSRSRIRLIQQEGKGKRAAVAQAVQLCRGEIVLLLDGDLSIAPEEIRKLYRIMCRGDVGLINGSRFRFPMEKGAMRWANGLANRGFARWMSVLLGCRLSDTLCGTKVFFREDFVAWRDPLTQSDPFGDFHWLIGAAFQQLGVLEVPLRYHARRYGETNIRRWRAGVCLALLMVPATLRIVWPGIARSTERNRETRSQPVVLNASKPLARDPRSSVPEC